ncbi:MAG: glycosyltransferase family 4 protein [Steroidobacteraceae bacterium]
MKFVFVESSRRAWGSEQHFINLAVGCHAAGHEVVAVVKRDSDVARLLVEGGVKVIETPFRGGADPRAMLATYRAIKRLRADWVITDHQKHYWALYFLARMTGTRVALFRHMAYVRGWLTRVLLPRLVDRFFVVSDFALHALAEAGAPETRLSKLYNPIDLQRFKPDPQQAAATRTALNLPNNAYLLGFIGRHEWGKGVDVLREALSLAMAQDPNLHAVWVGAGPLWSTTEQAIVKGDYADRHRMIDWTDKPEHYLMALDCLVVPSQQVETFGRIAAEAQACCVPLIASRIGGLAEAFEPDRSGLAYEGNCPAQLAKLILSIRHDESRRQWMGKLGRDFVKQFDTPYIVRLFEQALNDTGRPIARRRPATAQINFAEAKQLLVEAKSEAGVAG